MCSSWTIINNPVLSNTKGHLKKMHTIKIDLNQSTENQKKKKKTKRILIAKPELYIFRFFILFIQNIMAFHFQMLIYRKLQQMYRIYIS
jgi:hypothetical protein